MNEVMKLAIKFRKHESLQDVIDRLNSFSAWGQITADEYNELMELAQMTYEPIVEEPLPEGEIELSK